MKRIWTAILYKIDTEKVVILYCYCMPLKMYYMTCSASLIESAIGAAHIVEKYIFLHLHMSNTVMSLLVSRENLQKSDDI